MLAARGELVPYPSPHTPQHCFVCRVGVIFIAIAFGRNHCGIGLLCVVSTQILPAIKVKRADLISLHKNDLLEGGLGARRAS